MGSKSSKSNPNKILRPLTFEVIGEKVGQSAINCLKVMCKISPSLDPILMEPLDVKAKYRCFKTNKNGFLAWS